jgi:hypothetical protein
MESIDDLQKRISMSFLPAFRVFSTQEELCIPVLLSYERFDIGWLMMWVS